MLGFSLHVLQAIFVPSAFRRFPIFYGALVHICRSVVKDVMCIPLLTHGVYLCEAPSQIPCFTHWSHLGGAQTPVSVSSTDNCSLASPACATASGPLAEAGTRLAWLVPSCQESQRTAACGPGLEKYCSFWSSFLALSVARQHSQAHVLDGVFSLICNLRFWITFASSSHFSPYLSLKEWLVISIFYRRENKV